MAQAVSRQPLTAEARVGPVMEKTDTFVAKKVPGRCPLFLLIKVGWR
jgi:hypothetical protein